MDINVKVKIESPELMAALLAFDDALPQMQIGAILPIKEERAVEVKKSDVEAKNKNTEELKKEIKTIALEDVREKLALLSQTGKQPEVKALITKFGAKKLTDIDPTYYEELLKEAEAL